MIERIKSLAKKYAPEFIEVRHHLHAHPELSYQEFETSKFVQQKLREYNIPFEIKATTGIVGVIKGKNPESRVIALPTAVIPTNRLSSVCHAVAFEIFPGIIHRDEISRMRPVKGLFSLFPFCS